MIILCRPYGSYSNRLFQNLHFEAFCHEHQLAYANATFTDLQDYYLQPAPVFNSIVTQFWQSNLAIPFFQANLWKNARFFDDHHALDPSQLLSQAQQLHQAGRNLYVGGWNFRVEDLTAQHQELFRQKYTLKPDFYHHNPLWQLIQKRQSQAVAVVGVHVRRGDYRTWQQGKYYFSDLVYAQCMQQMAELLKRHGQNAVFIIFANEATEFTTSTDIAISNHPWYLDHFLMSQCDYLIGPPSTFTLWASYMGKTPFFHITEATAQIRLDAFTLCDG